MKSFSNTKEVAIAISFLLEEVLLCVSEMEILVENQGLSACAV